MGIVEERVDRLATGGAPVLAKAAPAPVAKALAGDATISPTILALEGSAVTTNEFLVSNRQYAAADFTLRHKPRDAKQSPASPEQVAARPKSVVLIPPSEVGRRALIDRSGKLFAAYRDQSEIAAKAIFSEGETSWADMLTGSGRMQIRDGGMALLRLNAALWSVHRDVSRGDTTPRAFGRRSWADVQPRDLYKAALARLDSDAHDFATLIPEMVASPMWRPITVPDEHGKPIELTKENVQSFWKQSVRGLVAPGGFAKSVSDLAFARRMSEAAIRVASATPETFDAANDAAAISGAHSLFVGSEQSVAQRALNVVGDMGELPPNASQVLVTLSAVAQVPTLSAAVAPAGATKSSLDALVSGGKLAGIIPVGKGFVTFADRSIADFCKEVRQKVARRELDHLGPEATRQIMAMTGPDESPGKVLEAQLESESRWRTGRKISSEIVDLAAVGVISLGAGAFVESVGVGVAGLNAMNAVNASQKTLFAIRAAQSVTYAVSGGLMMSAVAGKWDNEEFAMNVLMFYVLGKANKLAAELAPLVKGTGAGAVATRAAIGYAAPVVGTSAVLTGVNTLRQTVRGRTPEFDAVVRDFVTNLGVVTVLRHVTAAAVKISPELAPNAELRRTADAFQKRGVAYGKELATLQQELEVVLAESAALARAPDGSPVRGAAADALALRTETLMRLVNAKADQIRDLDAGFRNLVTAAFAPAVAKDLLDKLGPPAPRPAPRPTEARAVTTVGTKLPGSELTLNALMDLVSGATSYVDFLRTLTSRYKADSHGSFFALHGDVTVTPNTPQVFATYGKATIAYAPQMYAEILWTAGKETVHFQLVEEPGGRLSINSWKFDVNKGDGAAPMNPTPQYRLTPEEVKAMHVDQLVKKSNDYANVACLRCHMLPRRRMVEPDNHPRRFAADPNWVFNNPAQQREVLGRLSEIFGEFANGPAKQNPLYKWLWEQPEVVARGGKIAPNDTFAYREYTKQLIRTNGVEQLTEMQRHPGWPKARAAFEAAVNDRPTVSAELQRLLNCTPEVLATERAAAEKLHAEVNLSWIRQRNNESMAFILAKGNHDAVPQFENNGYLKLNRHAIETIGPRVLEMVVSEAQWKAMPATEQAKHVRLSELAVGSIAELRSIVSSPEVVTRTTKRTNAYLALKAMLNSKNKALGYISSAVRALSAETGNRDIDVLDVYAQELRGQPSKAREPSPPPPPPPPPPSTERPAAAPPGRPSAVAFPEVPGAVPPEALKTLTAALDKAYGATRPGTAAAHPPERALVARGTVSRAAAMTPTEAAAARAGNRQRIAATINDLVRELRAKGVPENELRVQVSERLPALLERAAADGKPIVDPAAYTPAKGERFHTEQIFASETGNYPFRVVIFSFAPGKRTNVHSHVMQGVEITLEGTAQERRFLPTQPSPGGVPRARLHEISNREPFDWDYVGRLGTDIHDVGNAGRGRVVTMHVYFNRRSQGGVAADFLPMQASIPEVRAAKERARLGSESEPVPADRLLDRGLTLFGDATPEQIQALGDALSRVSGRGFSTLQGTLGKVLGEQIALGAEPPINDVMRLVFRTIGRSGMQQTLEALDAAGRGGASSEAPYAPLSRRAGAREVVVDAFRREIGG